MTTSFGSKLGIHVITGVLSLSYQKYYTDLKCTVRRSMGAIKLRFCFFSYVFFFLLLNTLDKWRKLYIVEEEVKYMYAKPQLNA